MSDYARWLQDNDRHLAAAMEALRARLQRLAEGEGATATAPGAETPAPADAPTSPEHRSALELLADRLGLSSFERDIVLLCAAMELDTRTGALCARAQDDPSKPYPTFALAMRLFDDPAWEAVSPERPLRYWRLIEINQPGAQPLIGAALRADERIVNYLKGLNYLDDRLASVLAPLPGDPSALPPSQRVVADALVHRLQAASRDATPPLLQLLGSDTASKQAVAHAVANALGLQPYRLEAERVPAAVAEQEDLVRLWQRECMLLPIALYFDASDTGRDEAHDVSAQRFLARIGGLVFIDAREPMPTGSADALSIDVAKPTVEEQRAAWQAALGDAAAGDPQRLAGHFDFGIGQVRQVAGDALKLAGVSSQPLTDALWQGALARARPALDRLAHRIEPVAGWDDLQLPAQEKDLLRLIADQVALRTTVYDDWGFRARMNRGLGISALFAGESGTGKTMAAEVLARELGLLLYRIDLSAVVSKYIGETEKNLRRLFDAAEAGGAILFFDEADALFGRRSEVKDSHDRYANIEINYLLQRMESYHGLAILATNMKSALDAAFVRRLRFIVNFPFPGIAERRAIWSHVFPAKSQVAALDFDRLSRLALSGGSIQNIALNAAFMAARGRVPVTMPLLLEAARAEFRKLEKPINEAEFRWLEAAGGKA
jgi:ATPase family associated with various cellular activities (AAA)/Winged helix domain, variant